MAAMMRQICKQILTMIGAALLLLALVAGASAQSLVTRIVTDPLTGVAIDGYDVVTYFTEPEPLPGSPEYEYYWGGVPWYFVSAANRDVFMRAPDVYAPQHGGYCEMSLARGYLSDGKPRIYIIDKARLYLFYSAANREAFLLSPDEALMQAEANWPALSASLQGPDAELPVPEPKPEPAPMPSIETPTKPAEHP